LEYQTARAEVERIFAADLRELTESGGISVRPPALLGDWRIADSGKEMLAEHGLPSVATSDIYLRVRGRFQSGLDPEYRAAEGWSGYFIAECGEVRIVCAEVTDSVVAVPNLRTLPPSLAFLHPQGISDEVINQDVPSFVDLAWRWYWLSPLLVKMERAAGQADLAELRRSGKAIPDVDFYEPYRALCRDVRDKFAAVDQMAVGDNQSMWSNMIGGFE
jgi:hypothetical protein